MTVVEFEQLPDPEGGRYELHHGELVFMAPPKKEHYSIQLALRDAFAAAGGSAGIVGIELAFRPTPEHNYWQADVAFVSRERWDRIPGDGNLEGAPGLVVEVLSQLNTMVELFDRRQI